MAMTTIAARFLALLKLNIARHRGALVNSYLRSKWTETDCVRSVTSKRRVRRTHPTLADNIAEKKSRRQQMKIGKRFNQLTFKQYIYVIKNYKKYSDFNALGLYRSICETKKLNLNEKIEIRELANQKFGKTFNFLQLKDPSTYVDLITLGQSLTAADESQIWDDISVNQEKILKKKKIRHRNFGTYSKHNCGYDFCDYNGLMIRQGSYWAESEMHFDSDKNRYNRKDKSRRLKRKGKSKRDFLNEIDDLGNECDLDLM
jgi:hypothetical protein